MSVYVVDASVAAKWVFEETHTADALRLFDDGNRLHAPDFLLIELDSVVCKRIRQGQVSGDLGRQVRATLRQFPVQHHPFLPLLDPAFEIASRTPCSVYDCLYVALAAVLDGQMVTADGRLHDLLAEGPFARQVLWVGDLA